METDEKAFLRFIGEIQLIDFIYRNDDNWLLFYKSNGWYEVKTAKATHGFMKGIEDLALTPEGSASFLAHKPAMGIERARVFVVNNTHYEEVPDWQTACKFYKSGRLLMATDAERYRCAVYSASDVNMDLYQPKHVTEAPNGDVWFTARSGGKKYVFCNGWPVAGPYAVVGDLQIAVRRTYGVVFNTQTYYSPHWYVEIFPHTEALGPYCEVKRLHLFNGRQFGFRARTPNGWCLIYHQPDGLRSSKPYQFIYPLQFTDTHVPVCKARDTDGVWVLVGDDRYGPFDSVADPNISSTNVTFGTCTDGEIHYITVPIT